MALTIIMMPSCEKENLCDDVSCENGGTTAETDNVCECDCTGTLYIGSNCTTPDPSQVQALLDVGVTPIQLYEGGISLVQLYGKIYEGGLIFYLNTEDGKGMIAAIEDQSTGAEWGCFEVDLDNLNNVLDIPPSSGPETEEGARIGDGITNTNAILDATNGCMQDRIAAKLCRGLGSEWFLPSRGELNLMWKNLADSDGNGENTGLTDPNNLGSFEREFYWSSSEHDLVFPWVQDFRIGGQPNIWKNFEFHVRAARSF